MVRTSPDYEIFDRCNHTELYAMCRERGIHLSPRVSRERMIHILLGEEEEPEEFNEIDSWRHGLMGFLLDHWDIVQSQLDCPAKSGDPRSCFNCTDQMVVSCLTDNKNSLVQIQNYRKREY